MIRNMKKSPICNTCMCVPDHYCDITRLYTGNEYRIAYMIIIAGSSRCSWLFHVL